MQGPDLEERLGKLTNKVNDNLKKYGEVHEQVNLEFEDDVVLADEKEVEAFGRILSMRHRK